MTHVRISPHQFTHRCLGLLCSMLLLQLFHINYVAIPTVEVNLTWLGVAMASITLLALIISKTSEETAWPPINPHIFFLLFTFTFITVIIFSRAPYIFSYVQ